MIAQSGGLQLHNACPQMPCRFEYAASMTFVNVGTASMTPPALEEPLTHQYQG